MRCEFGEQVGLAGLIGDQHAAAVAHRLRRHVLIGLGFLHDGRGMDAGLGGKGALADIGRLRVGRAVEQFVEAARDMGEVLQARRRRCRFRSARCKCGFSASVRMIETRLALPQRSPMPLSVPWIWRTPASTAASELATACSVSLWAWMPRWLPGTVFVTVRTISRDFAPAACRHWCRTAPPSARRHHRPPWRRPAHRPGLAL